MAGMAEDQRFSSAGGHDLYPLRLLSTRVLFQVFECPDVMDFDLSVMRVAPHCSQTWAKSRFSSSDRFPILLVSGPLWAR